MSMAVDYRPQQALGGMGYDNKFAPHHFSNPWAAATTAASSPSLYHSSYQQTSPTTLDHPQVSKPQSQMSMGYVANPAASSLGSELVPSRSYGSTYSSPSNGQPSYQATAGARYSPEHVAASAPYAYDSDISRRSSYQASNSSGASYSDELASARGMVAMASGQDMTTPRNIYGTSHVRGSSNDSYGFPSTPSQHSSISSASHNAANGYPCYSGSSYAGSVDGSSVTDYSSASEADMMVPGSHVPRTLPAPSQLLAGTDFGMPLEPHAMMSQFNAKMSPIAQKKHKCKICEKRFTRPSSLQTHMFSHTGEKPFACDHEGCGRHFSVVSNLRRHKKVHKDSSSSMSDDNE